MTDPITCPECGGRRGEQVGAAFLACQFCHGRGWVGGEHEPAEQGQEPPDGPPPVWDDPRWRDPAIASAFSCRRCLGAGKVTSVDRERGVLVEAVCACRESRAG